MTRPQVSFGDVAARRARAWRGMAALVALTSVVVAAGCSSGGGGPATDGLGSDDGGATADLLSPTIGPAGRFDESPVIDTVDRSYILSVPASAVAAMAGGPVPLLIALHGAGDNADHFFTALGLDLFASKHAFVAAVPDGWGNAWFVQGNEGWPGDDGQDNGLQNDVHLLQEIIAHAASAYYIDASRIYVVGFSRGGGMTGLLAILSGNPTVLGGKYQSPFAAYAITSGYDATGGQIDPAVATPKKPIWILHGTADQVVPLDSGQTFADALQTAGWPVTFKAVSGAPHTWLWQARYGQSNDDLWTFFTTGKVP